MTEEDTPSEAQQNPIEKNPELSGWEKSADWMEKWPVTRILASMTHFMLIAAIVTLWIDYNERKEQGELLTIQLEQWGKERDFQTKSRIFAAWQTINTEAPGNSGKREAIEFLSQQGISLIGIDVSCDRNAGGWNQNKLECARPVLLTHIDLYDDTMGGGLLRQGRFQGVDFFGSELKSVDFEDSDLSGSVLASADVTDAKFTNTNVSSVKFVDEDRILIKGNLLKGLTEPQINEGWAWRDQLPILPDGIQLLKTNQCDPSLREAYIADNQVGRPVSC